MSKVIGVLGAGHMGGNMAQCLKDAGFAVFIYDAVDAARERMSDLGMNVCQSAKELASSCETVSYTHLDVYKRQMYKSFAK